MPDKEFKWVIPFEKWTGNKVKFDHLRIFRSKAFVLDKDPNKNKIAKRSIEGVFVGYPRERKGFVCGYQNHLE